MSTATAPSLTIHITEDKFKLILNALYIAQTETDKFVQDKKQFLDVKERVRQRGMASAFNDLRKELEAL